MEEESLLQSAHWQEFQKALGFQVWRLNQILVIKRNLPLGKNYLYSPRPSIVKSDFLEEVRKIAKKEGSIFFKVEPQNNFQFSPSVGGFNFQISPKQIQPQKTLILDIDKPEEDLLAQMHSKTRYNIRLAEKKGVIIRQDNEQVNSFIELLEQTAQRDKFHLHPREYYRQMIKILGSMGIVKLFLAEYQNKVIAANLISFFGRTAAYLHGASDYNSRSLMAPYLIQWRAILEAKKNGCGYYDFWGIDQQKYPGVTRFKKGFNGQEINYSGSFDLIFQPIWYKIYQIARRLL